MRCNEIRARIPVCLGRQSSEESSVPSGLLGKIITDDISAELGRVGRYLPGKKRRESTYLLALVKDSQW